MTGQHRDELLGEHDPSPFETPQRFAEWAQQSISPASWTHRFGTSIDGKGGRLIIVQSPAVHRRIERTLESVRSSWDSRTVTFMATVPAHGETTVEYSVKYTW